MPAFRQRHDAKVSFDPPLWLQRQSWVLSQLALHESQSVCTTLDDRRAVSVAHIDCGRQILEVGCSNAPLLQAVFPPPLYIYPNPEWRERGKKATKLARHPIFDRGPIAPRRMIILDIDYDALQKPVAMLEEVHKETRPSRRWYDFEVKVLCASLHDDLRSLAGEVDVVVATEVIEHLDEDMLERFAPSILGTYRPKVLLVTTPNYGFNVNFGEDDMLLDPTGRTDRRFRHDDHKFEWTLEEFTKWCHEAAQTHGYMVAISGVGEVGEDAVDIDESRYATHTAVFTKAASKDEQDYHIISATSLDEQTLLISPTSEKFEAFEIVEYEDVEYNREDAASSPPTIIAALDVDFLFPADYQVPEEEEQLSIVDLTHDTILYLGQELQNQRTKWHKTYEADIWSVWMCEDVRWACRGRLDFWFESLGINFYNDSFACCGEIQMEVKLSDLYLSIRVPDGNPEKEALA